MLLIPNIFRFTLGVNYAGLALSLWLILLFSSFLGAQDSSRVWEIDRLTRVQKERVNEDSSRLLTRRFLPKTMLGFKTQFPIQHAINLEMRIGNTPLSAEFGLGQFSSFYTLIALNVIDAKTEEAQVRKDFIKARLRNGSVIELGLMAHQIQNRFYAGVNLQFQRSSLAATPEELVEHFDLAGDSGLRGNIDSLVAKYQIVADFYTSTLIYPTIRPLQLGLVVGKLWRFKNPRLAIHAELGYSFNLAAPIKIEGKSGFLVNLLLDSYVNPLVEGQSAKSFSSFRYPSLALRMCYGLGKIKTSTKH